MLSGYIPLAPPIAVFVPTYRLASSSTTRVVGCTDPWPELVIVQRILQRILLSAKRGINYYVVTS